MAVSLVHFGVDVACRIPVLQSAGFQVALCSSVDSLIEILERERIDAVVISQRPELKVNSVVSAVHSRGPSTFVILFAEGPGQPYGTEADLVIPVLTPPWEWLAKIAELIAQRKALRAESQSLRAVVSLLRNESRAAGHRIAKLVDTPKIGKYYPQNKPTSKSGNERKGTTH